MKLESNIDRLTEVLRMFNRSTGIGLGVYSTENEKIALYPDEDGLLCQKMRGNPETRKCCEECDSKALLKCKTTRKIQIYTCHAGLTEVFAPIIDNGNIIAYISFGQMGCSKDPEVMRGVVRKTCAKYNVPCEPEWEETCVQSFRYKSYEQLVAMAGIMEICAKYLADEKIVKIDPNEYLQMITEFVVDHLQEKITVEMLCKELALSRTKLYEIMQQALPVNLTQFVKNKRMEKAIVLLLEEKLSVAEIAEEIGFQNYNYFSTVFKQEYGMSPLAYQKKRARHYNR